MNEWNIQSRSGVCQACAKEFADKQPYHTLLLTERDELQRLDLCKPCWEAQFGGGVNDRKGFISQWQGIFIAPPAVPPDAIQKESAETLLRKLIEANDPTHGPACFILAVMLERKRILKVKEQLSRDGRRVFLYEQARTGDLFTIIDPDLQLNQLESVQHDVAALLELGLDAAGGAVAGPEAVSPPAETPAAPEVEALESAVEAPGPDSGPAAESGPEPPSESGAAPGV